jgi:hypothetical protein
MSQQVKHDSVQRQKLTFIFRRQANLTTDTLIHFVGDSSQVDLELCCDGHFKGNFLHGPQHCFEDRDSRDYRHSVTANIYDFVTYILNPH